MIHANQMQGLRTIFRAFKYRNYRLYFFGQSISLVGTWMQNIAISWLVFRLTHSPVMMGVVTFAGQIPTFLIAPFAGVLIDRWKRHTIIVTTQFLAMIQALVLAVLTLSGSITVLHLILLSVCLGIITAFDMPSRQAFTVDIVENREDLGNAIALNSSIFNGARLIGPSIAGIIIAKMGEGICFLINTLSFFAVLSALLLMKIKNVRINGCKKMILDELKDGFQYALGFPPIRSILMLVFLTSLMGMPAVVLMPIFSSDILKGGPETLGFLMACSGIGALIGAFFLASRKTVLGLGKIIPSAAFVFGLGLIAFSLSRNLYLSMAFILVTGFGMMLQMASSNTLLQTIVDEDKRGRVMSFYTTSFMGASPLGSLMAGTLAKLIGTPLTVMFGGIACLAGATIFAARKMGKMGK